jgi:peptide/nickel transport system substrate-binding protein
MMELARLIVSAGLIFAFVTAPGASQTQRHEWTKPGILRYAIVGDPKTLNPVLSDSTVEDELDALFSDLLVGTDEHGRPYAQLAARVPTVENGDISKDGKSITFRLRRNVKWQDGVAFTSKDVRFSWQAIMNPANNVTSRTGYDLVETVETPDPYTAIFKLKHPYGPALATFFCSGQTDRIIPEHLLAKYPNLNQVDFNQRPIGTGPFKLVAWNRGSSIEFEANDDYFLGKPKLRHITVRIVPSTTTIGIELKTHEIDLALLDSATYRDVRNDPGVRVLLADQYTFAAIAYQMERPFLRDIRVRRAIAYAIDRKALIDRTTFGTGEPATGDIAPLSWAHTTDVVSYDYNPAKAAAQLDDAGWKPGPDGIRVRNGERLVLEFAETAGGTTLHGQDVLIQSYLKAVGIDAVIKNYAPALMVEPAEQGGIEPGGKYDITLAIWSAGADPDNSSLFLCSARPPDGQNWTRYCDKSFDAEQEQALRSYSIPVRKPIYARIERKLTEDLPMYFLYYPKRRIGMNPDLQGFKNNGVTVTANAYQWSL